MFDHAINGTLPESRTRGIRRARDLKLHIANNTISLEKIEDFIIISDAETLVFALGVSGKFLTGNVNSTEPSVLEELIKKSIFEKNEKYRGMLKRIFTECQSGKLNPHIVHIYNQIYSFFHKNPSLKKLNAKRSLAYTLDSASLPYPNLYARYEKLLDTRSSPSTREKEYLFYRAILEYVPDESVGMKECVKRLNDVSKILSKILGDDAKPLIEPMRPLAIESRLAAIRDKIQPLIVDVLRVSGEPFILDDLIKNFILEQDRIKDKPAQTKNEIYRGVLTRIFTKYQSGKSDSFLLDIYNQVYKFLDKNPDLKKLNTEKPFEYKLVSAYFPYPNLYSKYEKLLDARHPSSDLEKEFLFYRAILEYCNESGDINLAMRLNDASKILGLNAESLNTEQAQQEEIKSRRQAIWNKIYPLITNVLSDVLCNHDHALYSLSFETVKDILEIEQYDFLFIKRINDNPLRFSLTPDLKKQFAEFRKTDGMRLYVKYFESLEKDPIKKIEAYQEISDLWGQYGCFLSEINKKNLLEPIVHDLNKLKESETATGDCKKLSTIFTSLLDSGPQVESEEGFEFLDSPPAEEQARTAQIRTHFGIFGRLGRAITEHFHGLLMGR